MRRSSRAGRPGACQGGLRVSVWRIPFRVISIDTSTVYRFGKGVRLANRVFVPRIPFGIPVANGSAEGGKCRFPPWPCPRACARRIPARESAGPSATAPECPPYATAGLPPHRPLHPLPAPPGGADLPPLPPRGRTARPGCSDTVAPPATCAPPSRVVEPAQEGGQGGQPGESDEKLFLRALARAGGRRLAFEKCFVIEGERRRGPPPTSFSGGGLIRVPLCRDYFRLFFRVRGEG